MKYLITGGCGFLGSNLAAEALRRKERLVIFDNLSRCGSYQNLEWLKSQGEFQFIDGDIRNSNDVEKAIKDTKPDIVFHLAGQVAMTTSGQNPRLDFEVNAVGTINLLEAVRRCTPHSMIIYSSTNKVYGDLEYLTYEETETRYICRDYPNGFDEELPLDFHSPYGCSKGAADQYLLDYARTFRMRTIVFRHSSIYGSRQFATYDQGWVGWFCQQALATQQGTLGDPFTISGNGKQVRDVVHADDMKRLYFTAVENIEKAKGKVFNIGGGMANSLSLLELFALLEKYLSVRLRFQQLPPREGDQKIFVADIEQAREILSWQPLISAELGIQKVIECMESNQ